MKRISKLVIKYNIESCLSQRVIVYDGLSPFQVKLGFGYMFVRSNGLDLSPIMVDNNGNCMSAGFYNIQPDGEPFMTVAARNVQ